MNDTHKILFYNFLTLVIIIVFVMYVITGYIAFQLKSVDGIAYKSGFSCYRDDLSDLNYTEYIRAHERCHQFVNKDKAHFCEGED